MYIQYFGDIYSRKICSQIVHSVHKNQYSNLLCKKLLILSQICFFHGKHILYIIPELIVLMFIFIV